MLSQIRKIKMPSPNERVAGSLSGFEKEECEKLLFFKIYNFVLFFLLSLQIV